MLRFIVITFTLMMMFQPSVSGAEAVLIAVASDGQSLESDVSPLAGRAPYFLIVDGEGRLREAIENPFKDTRGGAGVSAAGLLAEKNVTIVVAEKFGAKMRDALAAKEIAVFEFEGTVIEAVSKILEKSGAA